MELTLSAIMAERTQHSGEDSRISTPGDDQGAPTQAASNSGQQESHDPSTHITNEDEQAAATLVEEGICSVAVEAAAAAAEAKRPSARVAVSPSPPAELAQFSEFPELWMKVTAFLGVPALGRLSCTASLFRAVLPTCVSISAASALHPNGRLPLHYAVMWGAGQEVVAALLQANPDATSKVDRLDQRLPLHHAVASQAAPEVVALLLQVYRGATRMGDEYKRTPLHITSQNSNSWTARMLVEAKADVHARDVHLMTPMHRAAGNGDSGTVRVLVEANADVHARDKNNRTPLYWATLYDSKEAIQVLRELGATE